MITMSTTKKLIVIVGPTAIGKTACSIQLAKHFNTVILSADSRQFYKEISIGTAKPSEEEMDGIPHFFINSHSITEDFNVNDFEKEALVILDEIFKRKDTAILVGGSGMYVDALCYGMDDAMPDPDEKIRMRLQNQLEIHGIESLQDELKQLDPVFYEEIDLNNSNRLMRAIEVCLITGTPYSTLRKGTIKKRPFEIIRIGLEKERELIYDRINQRVDLMMENGLLNEVKSIVDFRHQNALKTVGYRELFDYLDEKVSLNEAVVKIKVNSRRYAKRQLTWFKKDKNTRWFMPEQQEEMINFIRSYKPRNG
jgi:tRNA dimethylallyltransferase